MGFFSDIFGGGGDNVTSSSTSTQTTSISDSYNETRYDTLNQSDVGNVGAGAIATMGGDLLYSGAQKAAGNIRSNFGNITVGSPGANSIGGGLLDAIKPYLLYILAGGAILAAIWIMKK